MTKRERRKVAINKRGDLGRVEGIKISSVLRQVNWEEERRGKPCVLYTVPRNRGPFRKKRGGVITHEAEKKKKHTRLPTGRDYPRERDLRSTAIRAIRWRIKEII